MRMFHDPAVVSLPNYKFKVGDNVFVTTGNFEGVVVRLTTTWNDGVKLAYIVEDKKDFKTTCYSECHLN